MPSTSAPHRGAACFFGALRPPLTAGTGRRRLLCPLSVAPCRGKKDVVDLLDRCNRVEDALHDAAEEAEWSQRQRSLPLSSPQRSAPSSRAASPVKCVVALLPRRVSIAFLPQLLLCVSGWQHCDAAAVSRATPPAGRSPPSALPSADTTAPTRVPALRFNTTASQTHSTKPTRSTQIPPPPSATMMRPSSAYSPRHNTADMDAQHTPLAYMIAQYKEAEAAWNNEKARLRREAAAERKRANKYELDFKKLSALHDHKVMDIKALKAALKNRDTQLGAAQERIKELESMLTK